MSNKINGLREKMIAKGIDAFFISGSDPHQSEYLALHWSIRSWLTGFTGSAGVAIVTQEHSGLWTDSRYYIQAENELKETDWVMHKMDSKAIPSYIRWAQEKLKKGSVIALDGRTISHAQYDQFDKWLKPYNITLQIFADLISEIWEDRPEIPENPIFEHPIKFAGKSRLEKLEQIRKKMDELDVSSYLLTALDDIAWTFNLRGSDVECNPVFLSYACINREDAILFVNENKLGPELTHNLNQDNIKIAGYSDIMVFLNQMPENERVLMDPTQVNAVLWKSVNGIRESGQSISKWEKSIKNDIEIKHFRHTMAKDGAALAEAFHWLDKNIEKSKITEFNLAMKIAECRSRKAHYYGESFHAIVGYRSNGAIVHYRPLPEQCAMIENSGLLLVDSGGQYLDGTTDITRTFSMGEVSEDEKLHYTLVLKGMLALSSIRFPAGTTGIQLDILARQFLWSHGLDYGHGTGHGVGFFLNVHEPPQGFAHTLSERGKSTIKPGMVTSNEPGYYKVGHYGIRIENLIHSVEAENGFLKFETLTLYPYDISLIDGSKLTPHEVSTINTYHSYVFDQVSPFIDDTETVAWFQEKCAQIL
ncbi:MAG TPA: aminopeptidase P family protein [Saprospiraceae bacterium]|nr:aminopeptidase P family protein [Saprospiraceae bacterium]